MRREGQLHRRRGKAADAGFSLVELLIAVTILAIIVIPLLHLFVTSTRINVKSRQTLRATTVAQDIMEGLKAYTLEEVRTQFNTQDENGKFVLVNGKHNPEDGFYILSSDMIQDGVWEITNLEKDRDPVTGEPLNPDDPDNEIYYFGISDLKMQGGEYDALIKLDASTYTEKKAKDGDMVAGKADVSDQSGHDRSFNGKYYADVMSVSETSGSAETDSSYHEPADLSDRLMAYLEELIKDKYAVAGKEFSQEDWDKENIGTLVQKRTIRVEFAPGKEESGVAEADTKCQAKIKIQYECEYDGESYKISYGTEGFGDDDKVTGIPRTFTSGNFYLFYYPIYHPTYDSDPDKIGDCIEFAVMEKDASALFSDTEPLLRSVTLAKQVSADIEQSKSDEKQQVFVPKLENLYELERDYHAKVVFGTYPEGSSGKSLVENEDMIKKLTYRYNVDTNLATQDKSGRKLTPEERELENIAQVNPPDNDISLTGEDMVASKTTNVIYDIEITVFEKGAADKFAGIPTGSGVTQEALEQYYSDNDMHRLATITNLN